tara:strand:- start:5888 stop:8086 length:2199 start_codon:yes stop_codon:yes gene_type:complete
MPKIPTFDNRLRRGTITGEAASVPSGIQLSDQDNLALSVLRGSKEALDYFAVQKDNENKAEALELENQSAIELDDEESKASNLSNKLQAQNYFKEKSKNIRNKYLNRASSRDVKNYFNNRFNFNLNKAYSSINKKVSENIFTKIDNETKAKADRLMTKAFLDSYYFIGNQKFKDDSLIRKLPADLELLYRDSYTNRIPNVLLESLIKKIPTQIEIHEAVKGISDNPRSNLEKLLNPNEYKNIGLEQRQKLIRENKSALVPEVQLDFKNYMAAAKNGKRVDFDIDFAKKVLRTSDYVKIKKDYDSVSGLITDIQKINTLPSSEVNGYVLDRLQKIKDSNRTFLEKEGLKKTILTTQKNRNENIVKDPVNFIISTNDDIKNLFTNYNTQTNPELRKKNQIIFNDRIFEEQQRLGIDEENIKFVTENQSKNFVSNYMQANQNQRIALLRQLEENFGPYASNVMKQHSKNGLPITAELSSYFQNPSITKKFLSFDEESERKVLKEFGKNNGTKFNDIKTSLFDRTKDFQTSVFSANKSNTSFAAEKVNNILEVLTYYALNEMRAGKSERQALNTAESLINDSFEIQSTYFIPKIFDGSTLGQNQVDFIVDKAEILKDFYLKDFKPMAFKSSDQEISQNTLDEEMTYQLKNNGIWVNTADGKGLVYGLVFPDGSFAPVVNAAGKKFRFNFDDTSYNIPGTDQEYNPNIRVDAAQLQPRGSYPADVNPEEIVTQRSGR